LNPARRTGSCGGMTMRTWTYLAVLALVSAGAGTGAEAAARFSFRAIEFEPAEARLPAARRYLDRHAAPGTQLPSAIAAVRRAGTHCASRPRPDGAIRCRFAMTTSNSFTDMPPGDVTWTVRLYPAANGTVAKATVERERVGN
jgi:hypothetical protein